jgi:hypothetical protein
MLLKLPIAFDCSISFPLVPSCLQANGNDSELFFWVTWEAAQFCVLTKLRTPLGKPQDTFTTIEAALKKFACDALNKDNEDSNMGPEEMQGKIHLRVLFTIIYRL